MPGYGLAPADDGLLAWSWAEERLAEAHNYWLSTVGPDGAPHAVAVWGLWHNETFLFSTGGASRKARHLERDTRCVVTTERADEAVVVEGQATLVDDAATLERFFTAYQAKYPMGAPTDSPVFAVRPLTVFGFTELGLPTDATRWRI